MKKTFSYKSCYQILNLLPDSTYVELRIKYKKAIQKWHPDKFDEGSNKKIAATNKIKQVNIAYNQLQSFYKANGHLPPIELEHPGTHKTNLTQTNDNNHIKKTTQKSQNGTKSKERKSKSFHLIHYSLIILIFIGTYYGYDNNKPSTPSPTTKNAGTNYINVNEDAEHNIKNSALDLQENKSQQIDDDYFTKGSTISDVIRIQGVPNETIDNIWFYGKSEIHFKDGRVVKWVRSPETPLKARLKLN